MSKLLRRSLRVCNKACKINNNIFREPSKIIVLLGCVIILIPIIFSNIQIFLNKEYVANKYYNLTSGLLLNNSNIIKCNDSKKFDLAILNGCYVEKLSCYGEYTLTPSLECHANGFLILFAIFGIIYSLYVIYFIIIIQMINIYKYILSFNEIYNQEIMLDEVKINYLINFNLKIDN